MILYRGLLTVALQEAGCHQQKGGRSFRQWCSGWARELALCWLPPFLAIQDHRLYVEAWAVVLGLPVVRLTNRCQRVRRTLGRNLAQLSLKVLACARSWEQAQQACLNQGMVLPAAHSTYDYKEMAIATKRRSVWIGASDVDKEGQWTWADGSVFEHANWASSEPNGKKSESCGEMYSNGLMNDAPCSNKYPVLCMKRPSPPTVDSTYPAFSVSAAKVCALP